MKIKMIPDDLDDTDIKELNDIYDSKLKQHFMFTNENKYFREIIALAFKYLEDCDDIFIEVGVGLGKSGLAKTITEAFKEQYYIMTPKIWLMQQYEQMPGVPLNAMKGRSNFKCNKDICENCPERYGDCIIWQSGDICDASMAPCTEKSFKCKYRGRARFQYCEILEGEGKTWENVGCEYLDQYFNAKLSKKVLTNPSYLFTMIDNIQNRKLAIYDEGHNILDILVNECTKEITEYDWKKIFDEVEVPFMETLEEWGDFLLDINNIVRGKVKELEIALENSTTNPMAGWKLKKGLRYFENLLERVIFIRNQIKDDNCILDYDETTGKRKALFKPVSVAKFARSILDTVSEKRIYMSATFRDPKYWTKVLGLNKDRTGFIICEESNYPVENRRIYIMPSGSMSKDNRDKNIPQMARKIDSILDENERDRGIILPYSYKLGNDIYENMYNKDRIIIHTYDKFDRERKIKQFVSDTKNNKVIISPYLNEGFDGKDDIARFLILCKTPFLNLGDKYVSEKLKRDYKRYHDKFDCDAKFDEDGFCKNYWCHKKCTKWYKLSTVFTLIQMSGRIVRHEKDYGKIYILDDSFRYFYERNFGSFPNYFREAIIWEK